MKCGVGSSGMLYGERTGITFFQIELMNVTIFYFPLSCWLLFCFRARGWLLAVAAALGRIHPFLISFVVPFARYYWQPLGIHHICHKCSRGRL